MANKVELIPDPREEEEEKNMESTVNQTPSETPEEEETPANMWSDLDSQLDAADEELEQETKGEAPPAPTETSKAEEKKEEEEAPKEEKAEEEQSIKIPEEETPAPETQTASEAKVSEQNNMPQKTPEEIQKEFAEAREKVLTGLEAHFEISDDEADEFMTNPKSVVPKLAARLYLDVFESVMRGVHQSVPNMIVQTQEVRTAQQQAEKAFYEKWPVLKDKQYEKTVLSLAGAYRQANPTAPTEQFIRDVGAQAVVALQLPYAGMQEEVQLPTGVKPADNIPPPKPGGQGTVQRPAGTSEKNPFTLLDMEFDAEEDS